MKKLHLFEDLKLRKQAIKKEILNSINSVGKEEAQERKSDVALELINRKTQEYSKEEALNLIGWYINSHDECIIDNPEDFHPLQVHIAQEKMNRVEFAFKLINNLN
jgi:hypothetical protein